MSQWSIPINQPQQGWKLRVLSGRMLGTEFDLPNTRYVLGSQSPADIVIAHPDIAPQHLVIELRPDGVHLTDGSRGRGVMVNGRRVNTATVAPGDHIEVGPLKFEFSNPGYKPPSRPAKTGSVGAGLEGIWTAFEKWQLWQRVGLILLAVATVLFLLLACTGTPTLVPVTLIAMSAVVPATVICWLVEKYNPTRFSFHTLAITFLAGGTIGVIAAMFNFMVGDLLTCGMFTFAIFAGVAEEPAKLLGTAWRWRHPMYDRPMDGLILGTVSGFGFAVMETAGYGFNELWEGLQPQDPEFIESIGRFLAGSLHLGPGGVIEEVLSYSSLLYVLMLRSLTSPFAHGLWSGILAAGFWACGRNWNRAVRSKEFWASAGLSIGLHALWNSSFCGIFSMIASAALSVFVYRRLWINKGYLSFDRHFWGR